MLRHVAGLLVLAATVYGCHSHDCPEGSPAISAFSASKTTLSAGEDVTLTLGVANFEMTGHEGDGHDHAHDSECPNGHAHIYLDKADGTLLGMALEASITVAIPTDTTPGPHKLVATLQDVDHKALSPPVEKTIDIIVK